MTYFELLEIERINHHKADTKISLVIGGTLVVCLLLLFALVVAVIAIAS